MYKLYLSVFSNLVDLYPEDEYGSTHLSKFNGSTTMVVLKFKTIFRKIQVVDNFDFLHFLKIIFDANEEKLLKLVRITGTATVEFKSLEPTKKKLSSATLTFYIRYCTYETAQGDLRLICTVGRVPYTVCKENICFFRSDFQLLIRM